MKRRPPLPMTTGGLEKSKKGKIGIIRQPKDGDKKEE
jgi:hypothetical protein